MKKFIVSIIFFSSLIGFPSFSHVEHYKEFNSPNTAIKKADALLIFTEWKEFWSIDISVFKKFMNNPVIFDGRNIYSPKIMRDNQIDYFSFGRASLKKL